MPTKLILAIITICLARSTHADAPPNIVLIIADDLGYGELSADASHQIPTPNLNRLIDTGTYCSNAYVTAPFCAASRAGLMTGRYQTRFGFEFNPIGHVNEQPGVGIPQSEYTLPEMLRDAGYATGLVGKWHLGGSAEFHPLRHGFEEFFGFLHEGHFFVPPPYDSAAGVPRDVGLAAQHGERPDGNALREFALRWGTRPNEIPITTMLRRKSLPPGYEGRWASPDGRLVLHDALGHNEPPYDANNPILQDGQPVVVDQYLTRVFGGRATEFIRRHQREQRPYFLTLAFSAVHSPLQAPSDVVEKFQDLGDIHRQIFAAMYTEMDDAIGRVLDQIDRHESRKNTLVIFLSDNGGPTRELTSSNAPLRGQKGQVFEGGLRIPFVIRWPGRVLEGAVSNAPVISTDIFETCRVATESTINEDVTRDGRDLLPIINGASTEERDLYWRVGNRRALRRGPWKLIAQPDKQWGGPASGWKLVNLADDLSEATDVAADQAEIAKDLESAWDTFNGQMVERLW